MKLYNDTKFSFDNIDGERKGKGRHFTSKFIEAGIVSYEKQGGLVYLVKKEVLDKFVNTFIGCPVIIDHDDITDENVRDKAVGYISKVWFNDADGWYYCDGIITDRDAEDLILNKNWSVSCGYVVTEKDENGGIWHDIEYDAEILNGDFEHLAIVKSPRYRDANILLNSTEEKKEMLNKMFSAKKIRNAEGEEKEADGKEEVKNEAEAKAEDPKKQLIDLINSIGEDADEEVKETLYSKADGLRNMCKNSDAEDGEEEKAENMCKNEADEEEDEKKEKAEKVENSSNSSFKKVQNIRNSVPDFGEPESLYLSEAKRLELGKDY